MNSFFLENNNNEEQNTDNNNQIINNVRESDTQNNSSKKNAINYPFYIANEEDIAALFPNSEYAKKIPILINIDTLCDYIAKINTEDKQLLDTKKIKALFKGIITTSSKSHNTTDEHKNNYLAFIKKTANGAVQFNTGKEKLKLSENGYEYFVSLYRSSFANNISLFTLGHFYEILKRSFKTGNKVQLKEKVQKILQESLIKLFNLDNQLENKEISKLLNSEEQLDQISKLLNPEGQLDPNLQASLTPLQEGTLIQNDSTHFNKNQKKKKARIKSPEITPINLDHLKPIATNEPVVKSVPPITRATPIVTVSLLQDPSLFEQLPKVAKVEVVGTPLPSFNSLFNNCNQSQQNITVESTANVTHKRKNAEVAFYGTPLPSIADIPDIRNNLSKADLINRHFVLPGIIDSSSEVYSKINEQRGRNCNAVLTQNNIYETNSSKKPKIVTNNANTLFNQSKDISIVNEEQSIHNSMDK